MSGVDANYYIMSTAEVDFLLVALGESIRDLRHGLGISQEELGFRCNLHRTYISDLERGNRNVSFAALLSVAEALGVSVSQLTKNIEQK